MSHEIVSMALKAATLDDATALQGLIAQDFGSRFERPIADTWNNHGLMSASGNYDFKLIELVTNMQDAVLERAARVKYGDDGEVPYESPFEAAADLFAGIDPKKLAQSVRVEFRESDGNPSQSKRLTAVFRDHGCGLASRNVPRTVFRLGGSHKEDALYLQGAFGMGGAMTYRNARAVVLVTRVDPLLLDEGREDRITVAVVEWQEKTKGSTALYLVDQPWVDPGDPGEPWSCSARDFPDFEPGTHVALISYGTDGIQRKTERDERTFPKVIDTRLFDPVLPVRFVNHTDRGKDTYLYGLRPRLENLNAEIHPSANEVLPFRTEGHTSRLPVRFVMFNPRRHKGGGGIDSFVAARHAVVFTSNGQVHHHWDSDELRRRTGFNKIHDRVLVVVDTDELPIHVRTSLFTPDRNSLVRTGDAIRLEDTLAGFLKDWDSLREQNNKLVREGLMGSSAKLSAELGRRIGKAFSAKGFGSSGSVSGAKSGGQPGGVGRSGGGNPGQRKKITLHPDPTRVDGASNVVVERGTTRSVRFVVDAEDGFWRAGRGELQVTCDHPGITPNEITVGSGSSGVVRVMIAVPDEAELGDYALHARLSDWHRQGGGLGPELGFITAMTVVDEIPGRGVGSGSRPTGGGGGAENSGTDVVVRWSNQVDQEEWGGATVGEVEEAEATVLSELEGYSHLASLGRSKVPVITLNETYAPLKSYLARRSKKLTDLQRPKEKYALGVGLALLRLQKMQKDAESQGRSVNSNDMLEASQAAAMAVLSVMPEFDQMVEDLGGEG